MQHSLELAWREGVRWIVLLWFFECNRSRFYLRPHSACRRNKRKRVLSRIGRRLRTKKSSQYPPGKAKSEKGCQDFEKHAHAKVFSVPL